MSWDWINEEREELNNEYIKDQVLYERENMSIYSVYSKNNSKKRKIILQITLKSLMRGMEYFSLEERKDKIKKTVETIQREFNIVKALSLNSFKILFYEEMWIEKAEEPYEIKIFIQSEYKENLIQTKFYQQEKSIRLGKVLEMAILFCDVLEELTEKEVYHRFLNPYSIFMDKDEKIFLGNIGFSIREKEPFSHLNERERSYIAPELFQENENYQWIHFENIDVQTEIYAVGAILYEILDHNHILFLEDSSSEEEGERRRLKGEIPPPPDTGTVRLGRCIQKACHPKREERYKTFEQFCKELVAIDQSLPDIKKQETIYQSMYNDLVEEKAEIESVKDTNLEEKKKKTNEEKQKIKEEEERKKREQERQKKLEKEKKELKKNKGKWRDEKEEKEDYKDITKEDIENEEKGLKRKIIFSICSVIGLIAIIILVLGNQKQSEIYSMIDSGTYAIAMHEITQLHEKDKNVDELCKRYIEACLSEHEGNRVPEAVALLSDEVSVDYYKDLLDKLQSAGTSRSFQRVAEVIYEKSDECRQMVENYGIE